MKRWWLTLPLAVVVAALVQAAPPVEADPNKDIAITAEAGPFVVVVTSYRGKDGPDLARQLVTYLRQHDRPGYVWNYAEKQRAELNAEKARWEQQHPGVPFRGWRIEDEYGVLIGGYETLKSAEDDVKVLKEDRKKFPCPDLKLPGGKFAYDTQVIDQYDETTHKLVQKRYGINPLLKAFPSRNPALGMTKKKADPFLKELNALEDYNLLKCSAPWTMVVKSYGAGSTFVPMTKKVAEDTSMLGGFMDKLWGKPNGEALNGAAAQAHETARVLRELGFEAYVLHTRNSSLVTIGGFNSPAEQGMITVAERLASLKLDKLELYREPYTCEVPRP